MISAVSGQIVLLLFAVIPLLAGIGILRKRTWSAYGMALYFFAQLIPAFVILFRSPGSVAKPGAIIASAGLSVMVGCLFLFAGRSLAKAGAVRGRPVPWIAISALFSVPLLFLQPFVIPTGAMEDTLLIGDRIIVQRFPMPAVTRGDVIVFAYPVDRRQTFVKRVIGVAGDRIRLANKLVYRNGMLLAEPYALHKTDYQDPYRDNFPSEPNMPLPERAEDMLAKHVVNGEVVVPQGSYFVMGDNRDSSLDSRYWGFVGFDDVIGKPRLIYDSEIQSTDEIMDRATFRWHTVRWRRLFKLL
jgi:signal peptidase I